MMSKHSMEGRKQAIVISIVELVPQVNNFKVKDSNYIIDIPGFSKKLVKNIMEKRNKTC